MSADVIAHLFPRAVTTTCGQEGRLPHKTRRLLAASRSAALVSTQRKTARTQAQGVAAAWSCQFLLVFVQTRPTSAAHNNNV